MTVPPLVDEVTRKSGVVWVRVPGHPPKVVWHVWYDGADYVLHGGGEQDVPGLADATTVEVDVRAKSNGAGILTWAADVTTVAPDSDAWDVLEPLLRKTRLNAEPDPTGRWRSESQLSRLRPR